MSSLESAPRPRESATVILVRNPFARPWEVFLARRHRNQSFMAEAYVFPGGQVATADADRQWNDYVATSASFNPQKSLQDNDLTREVAQSFFVCAIRETFEEAGVLIAQTTGGKSVRFGSDPNSVRFDGYRRELNAGKTTLLDIARKENLLLTLDALIPYAHWITPEISPKRFRTLFFLAKLPESQVATTDCEELTEGLWAAPGEILQKYRANKVMLMPPTLKTLEELTAFSSLDALFTAARSRVIYPILPEPSGNILKLPHDPEYNIEKYKQPARPDEPSRITFINGIWQTGFSRTVEGRED